MVCDHLTLHILSQIAKLNEPSISNNFHCPQIKPVVNQVNLDSCCVMPKDLIEYAKSNDIQLLTHNDPRSEYQSSIVLELFV